ncbi:hypothetical protein [Mesorhizobium sp. M0684]|uniref:hypothetical protein n=1 Tax=unclassified Mesorhizobium TaxID=325217 RepID=UPI00333B2686
MTSTKKTPIEIEIDCNGVAFADKWSKEIAANIVALTGEPALLKSYRRITAVQAIKVALLKKYSAGSAEFFYEAHNDIITSHVCASFGAWRTSLQTLRSAIENALCAIYFRDHPIELERWNRGEYKTNFQDLCKYCETHPKLIEAEKKLKVIDALRAEYSTLSKAVHSSAKNFRMSDAAGKILMWSTERPKLGMWGTRHTLVVQGIVLLMSMLESPQLVGTMNSPVRSQLFFAISTEKRKALKEALGITVSAP